MDWYKLAPPAVAINREAPLSTGAGNLTSYKEQLINVAADGATRVSFCAATISALGSLASLSTAGRQFQWWGLVALAPFVLLIATLVWVLSQEPGDLVSRTRRFVNMSGAQFCRALLLVWNLLLGLLIVVTSQSPTQ